MLPSLSLSTHVRYDTAAWYGELRAGELLFVPCAGAHVFESRGASLAVRYAHHDEASVACARDTARALACRGGGLELPPGSWPRALADALASHHGGGLVREERVDNATHAAPSVLELRHAMGCDDAMMADRLRVWSERRENARRRSRT